MAEPGISIEGGSRPTPSNLPEDFDVSQREDVAKLRKHAVGYVATARKKTTAGRFYPYLRHGLGRELGIGTG